MNAERKRMETKHGPVSYIEVQGNPRIFFLHGLGGRANNWLKLARVLDGGYGMVMVDLPGHGNSTRNLPSWDIHQQIEVLDSFLSGFPEKKKILAGNSYGGWIATRYAIDHGGVRALILIDSAGTNSTLGEDSPQKVKAFLERVMANYPRNDPEILGEILRQNSFGTGKISREELESLSIPVSIIWGENDRVIPLDNGKFLHSMISGSRFRIVSGAGHTPHYTHPEETASEIRGFLSSINQIQ